MKIFGVGLARTGTTSLCRALEVLGYSTVHNPRGLGQVDMSDAAADEPIARSYRALDEAYPGSRFVLTLRDVDEWATSVAWLWGQFVNLGNHPKSIRESARRIRLDIYGTAEPDVAMLKAGYLRHVEGVRRHFSGRGDLLEMSICSGDGWEKLCPFLGRPFPNSPFPRTNSRTEMVERRSLQHMQRKLGNAQ